MRLCTCPTPLMFSVTVGRRSFAPAQKARPRATVLRTSTRRSIQRHTGRPHTTRGNATDCTSAFKHQTQHNAHNVRTPLRKKSTDGRAASAEKHPEAQDHHIVPPAPPVRSFVLHPVQALCCVVVAIVPAQDVHPLPIDCISAAHAIVPRVPSHS